MTTATAACCPPSPAPDLADEAGLIARLGAGDHDAFAALVRTHSGAMTAVARRFFGDTDDAADAVQDALVSAFRSVSAFGGTARLGTWLHRITVNACLMKLRVRRRSRLVPLDESARPTGRADGDPLTRAEVAARVRAGIDRLPDVYRSVILLREIEGVDTAEAAYRLGLSRGAAKVRLHRARQALRAILEPDFGDGAPG